MNDRQGSHRLKIDLPHKRAINPDPDVAFLEMDQSTSISKMNDRQNSNKLKIDLPQKSAMIPDVDVAFLEKDQEKTSPLIIQASTKYGRSYESRIKCKQARLLLLRHASLCNSKDGECKVTPYCAQMKRLWNHINMCNNDKCKENHCSSSKRVMQHYRNCVDNRCQVCIPVRKTFETKSSCFESSLCSIAE